MTTFIIDLVQPATECNLGLTRRSPMAWTLAPGAPLAPSPLTAEGMAAYAGVMTMFTGTGDNDSVDITSGTLTGFTGGTVADLSDEYGDTFNAGAGDDYIGGGGSDDSMNGGDGADSMNGGAGADGFNLANGDFVSGESIDGGDGSDGIKLTESTTIDFTDATTTISSVERFEGSDDNDTVTMTAEQWAGFIEYIMLGVGTDVLNVNVSGSHDISQVTPFPPAYISVGGNGNLTGTSGSDSLNLTGAQLDAIIIGAGTINLGAGNDALYLTSNSEDLNTLGAMDTSIQNVEIISAAGATTPGSTINLSAQTEAFSITGSAGSDWLVGGTGNDTIGGGSGGDTIDGGAGDDTITFDGSEILIAGGAGDDTLKVTGAAEIDLSSSLDQASLETATVTGFENVDASTSSAAVSLTGDANGNVLIGGQGTDTINGGGGNDTITFDGSDVSIAGGVGIDTLIVKGAATITLSVGTVTGLENVDASTSSAAVSLTGDANGNVLIGGQGADTINGGAGDDTITFDGSDVSIAGGAGIDTLIVTGATTIDLSSSLDQASLDMANVTGFENVDVSTSSAAVSLTGDANANALTGGAGNDTITGGAGADTMSGGAGNDVYVVDNTGDKVIESASGGLDSVQSAITFSLLNAGAVETLTLTGTGSIKGTGNTYNNTLTGNTGSNVLDGGAGNDTIYGGAGNDTITGGTGADTMSGGAGNDVYVVDSTGDKVIESTSGGLDSVQSAITFSLAGAGAVETLTLTGTGNIKGTGNTYNNTLTGNAGANALTGGSGNDTLNGGTGKDTLTGGAGKDTFFFNAALSAANSDKITDFSVRDDTVRLENAVFAALKATGTLASAAFYVGAAAHDASDRIIYNKTTGALTYDSNGNAAGGAVQFATLAKGLALTNADFVVV